MSTPLFPSEWSKIWIRGTFINLDGSPMAGQVSFAANVTGKTMVASAAKKLIAARPLAVTLDGAGYFQIQIPATNDPDITPLNFTYTVAEPTGRTYSITVPWNTATLSALGDPLDGQQVIDLTSVVPSPGASGGVGQLLRGVGIESIVNNPSGGLLVTYTDGGTATVSIPDAVKGDKGDPGEPGPASTVPGPQGPPGEVSAAQLTSAIAALPFRANNTTTTGAAVGGLYALRQPSEGQFELDGPVARVVEGPLSFRDPRVGGTPGGSVDNTAAWNAAIALLTATPGELYVPPGVYRIDGTTDPVPGGVWVTGAGYDYSDPESAVPSRGSVLRAGAAMTRLVQLGPTGSGMSSTPGEPGGTIRSLVLDGRDLANSVVTTEARRNNIIDCQVYWGLQYGVWFKGQNSVLRNSVVSQNNKGDCVLASAYYDHKIVGNQLRQFGTPNGAGVRANNINDLLISQNHIWSGQNGVAFTGQGDIVIGGNTNKVVIANNVLDGVLGPQILLDASGPTTLRDIAILGNLFFSPNLTDNTYGAIRAQGTGGLISSVGVVGNVISGEGTGKRYKSIIDFGAGITSTVRWTLIGNAGTYCENLSTGTPPDRLYQRGNAVRNGVGTIVSDNSGKATFNGTGSQTVFTIPHGLNGTPVSVRVTPGSDAASGPHYATADGTQIAVTFVSAPASGTGNTILNWQAEL